MRSSAQLKLVVDMAKNTLDQAAIELQKSIQLLAQQEQSQRQLDEYYREYDLKFNAFGGQVRASDFSAKRNFLAQLSGACKVQASRVEEAKISLARARENWQQCHLRHENLLSLVQRQQQEEINARERVEQKQMDDWVTQGHVRGHR